MYTYRVRVPQVSPLLQDLGKERSWQEVGSFTLCNIEILIWGLEGEVRGFEPSPTFAKTGQTWGTL